MGISLNPAGVRATSGSSVEVKTKSEGDVATRGTSQGPLGHSTKDEFVASQSTSVGASTGGATPKWKAAQKRLDELLNHDGNYTILGDTNHRDQELRGFLADEGTMEVLRKNGVKCLAMEIRPEFAGIVDQVNKGDITPEEYASKKAAIYGAEGVSQAKKPRSPSFIAEGKIIQAAGKKGIEVLPVEVQAKDLAEHAHLLAKVQDGVNRLDPEIRTKPPTTQADVRQGDEASAQAPDKDQRVAQWTDSTLLRGEADAKIAEAIKKKSKERKTVVLYGATHGALRCDLDKHLPGPQTRIDLYPNETALKAGAELYHNRRLQPPSVALNLSTGAAVKKEDFKAYGAGGTVLIDKTPNVCPK